MSECRTILVVDDSLADQESFRRCLERGGYRVICAEDGLRALELLRQGEVPGLILLDLLMPVMDGWEFRQRQLADEELAEIPVVVTTTLTERYRSANELDAAAYVSKPVANEELMRVAHQWAGGHG